MNSNTILNALNVVIERLNNLEQEGGTTGEAESLKRQEEQLLQDLLWEV